jgi:hypothetical protein
MPFIGWRNVAFLILAVRGMSGGKAGHHGAMARLSLSRDNKRGGKRDQQNAA